MVKIHSFLYVLQTLGWTLYAGPMIAFSIMSYTNKEFYKSFSHFGVGFGLSLTLWIYSTIAIQYLSHGHFFPELGENLWIPAAIAMWISNIKLEIWTLDPIRKSKDPIIPSTHLQSLRSHLTIHACLIALVQILCTLNSQITS